MQRVRSGGGQMIDELVILVKLVICMFGGMVFAFTVLCIGEWISPTRRGK